MPFRADHLGNLKCKNGRNVRVGYGGIKIEFATFHTEGTQDLVDRPVDSLETSGPIGRRPGRIRGLECLRKISEIFDLPLHVRQNLFIVD